jgi:hypothetical protein
LAVRADTDEDNATMSVREAHHRIDNAVVAYRRIRFGDELRGVLLTSIDESAELGVGEQEGSSEVIAGWLGKLSGGRTRSRSLSG